MGRRTDAGGHTWGGAPTPEAMLPRHNTNSRCPSRLDKVLSEARGQRAAIGISSLNYAAVCGRVADHSRDLLRSPPGPAVAHG